MIFSSFEHSNQVLPRNGRILALDIGTKRIGFALSDETQFIATPKFILSRQSNKKDFIKIIEFINQNKSIAIVIGCPINMDGSPITMTEFVQKFAQNLNEFLEDKLPIFLFEERLTSFEAREIVASRVSIKKTKFVDDIAASFILQHFLDEKKRLYQARQC
jgi:putative Holliday junction resolvase